MKRLQEFLKTEQKKRILDIGTGTGEFIQFISGLYDAFTEIIGIDRLERMVDAARTRFEDPRIHFQVMDGNAMTFDTNSFDIVMLSNSLHHLDDIPRTLQEMARVVKPDGFILINEMLNNDLDLMQLSHLKIHHFAARIDRLNGQTHNETYHKDVILQLVEEGTNLSIQDAWELDVPRRTETPSSEQEHYFKIVDTLLARAPKEKQKQLLQEAEDVKQHIKDHGLDGCTSLLVVLRSTT